MNGRTHKANRVTWVGFFVNIILTFFKLLSGISGKSAAMIADAFHSLSDFATDIVVLLGFRIIDKPADENHDYGHGKVETLVSVIIGVGLLSAGLRICWTGLYRVYKLYQGELIPRPGLIAFYAAAISIVSKEWLYRYTVKAGKAINSRAVIVNAWHHRSDAFSSIGTMMGIGGAIILGGKWHVLDPIAAIAVSFFIIKTAIVISVAGFNELTEASLSDETESEILNIIRAVPGVKLPHNLRTRRIGNYVAIDMHIKVDKGLDIAAGHAISTNVEEQIKKTFGEDAIISVHIEPHSCPN